MAIVAPSTSPVSTLLERLDCVKQSGKGWIARCPAHADGRPSLKVDTGDDGRALLHCFGGCEPSAICAALGMEVRDLFERDAPAAAPTVTYATSGRVVYDFNDAGGAVVFQEVRDPGKRFWLRRPDGKGGWITNMDGAERPLWNLPELIARPGETVYLCEGAKDATRLRDIGLLATTTANGASAPWLDAYSEALRGRDVAILADNDAPGIACAHKRAEALQGTATSVKVVLLPDLPPKGDVSDWLGAGHTVGELIQFVNDAPAWTSGAADQQSANQPVPAWDLPIPFDDPTGPPVPIDAFPDQMRAYIQAVAIDTGAPLDLVAWPPAWPELHPVERVWRLVDEPVANRTFADLDELKAVLVRRCQILRADRRRIKAHTRFHWGAHERRPRKHQ